MPEVQSRQSLCAGSAQLAVSALGADSGASGYAEIVVCRERIDVDRLAVTDGALTEAKKLPMFWSFVGFGDDTAFLRAVNTLPGAIDNTGFCHVSSPCSLTDEALYAGITKKFGAYLRAAESLGILR